MVTTIVLMHKDEIYHTTLITGQKLSFGSHKKDNIQVPGFGPGQISLQSNRAGVALDAGRVYRVKLNPAPMDNVILLDRDTRTALFIGSQAAASQETLRLPYDCTITFGRRPENDVCIDLPFVSGRHFVMKCEAGHVRVEDMNSTNGLFLNGNRIGIAGMKSGDVLSVLSVQIKLQNGELSFYNTGDHLTIRQPDSVPLDDRTHMSGQTQHFLHYRRSPRIQNQLPHEDIVLAPPPAKGQKFEKGRGMFSSLLGSGVMLATGVLTTAVSPALLAARAASMVAPAVSAVGAGKDNKRRKRGMERYEEARLQRYGAYIQDQKARIESVAKVQRDIITAENPSPEDCMETLYGLRRSLWERMPSDRDFLDVRMGMGYEDLCIQVKSRADYGGVQMEDDEVRELSQQIIEETRIVDNVPARLQLLLYNTVGFVGERKKVVRLIKNMMVSLTSVHCAEDVRIVGIFDRREQAVWEPMRWLPHVQGEDGGPRLLAFDRRNAHALCGFLEELARERRDVLRPSGLEETEIPSPHYILLFGSKSMVEDEPVMRELLSGGPGMGVTSLFLFDDIYQLPHDCRYIVDMDNGPSAFSREESNRRTYFTPDEYVGDGPFDLFARRQSAIRMEGFAKTAGLPDGVTFLQGFGADTVERLDAPSRWESSRPYETLMAPIGVMSGNRVFALDIAETGHGPHGLVAGTTGSGKSELLQTWILSMAVTYHPYDVEFVIIDYKGGGMANLLEPLPHVVGKITNIGANIGRLLLSLQYEKEKRLSIFDRYGVNHIDKYQKLYRQGKAPVPMPHLVIVADEFAELKKEEPAFMAELVSAARVGRSLGIHLVLATQKPAGVVDDQIQSNARFRLCLKVQDAADSRDMLRRPDAAKITRPGRAYVRVGEDELYELFQSYWSGAPYTGGVAQNTEGRVYVVDVLGRRLGPRTEQKPAAETDELSAVVKYIRETAEKLGIEKLQGPWLPELPGEIPLRSLIDRGFDGQGWNPCQPWLAVPIGKFDAPATQSQGVQFMDLSELGHFGIYGAPGTGKTTLLKTVVLSLGLCYSPEDVNIYILDCGGWGMSVFGQMPHVGGVALDQEAEKFQKLERLILEEFESRKRIFLKNAVSSLGAYRESGGRLPAIVIAVDNFVPVFDLYPDMENFFITLAREGAAYGIYLIYTANSTTGVRYRVAQNIRGAVAFELSDRGDYAALVGRPAGTGLPAIAGRAYYKGTPPVEFQAALFAEGSSERERTLCLQRLLEEMDAAWQGSRPRPIPVMPETVTAESLMGEYTRPAMMPVGVDQGDVSTAFADLTKNNYSLLVAGPMGCGKSALLRRLGCMAVEKHPAARLFVVDSAAGALAGVPAHRYAKCCDLSGVSGMLSELIDEMNARKRAQNQARTQSSGAFDEGAFAEGLEPFIILIDDLREFVEGVPEAACDSMERICRLAQGLGVVVLAAGRTADMARLNEIETLTRQIISGQKGLLIAAPPAQAPFFQNSLGFEEKNAQPESGYGWLYDGGSCRKIKLME